MVDQMSEVRIVKISGQGRDNGFTLLEALIAIAILSVGLLAVVTMIDISFSASTLGKNTTKATELASWMMDRLRQESSLSTATYSTNITNLRTFKNDPSSTATRIILDTNIATVPADPGGTIFSAWKTLIQDPANLPNGRGVVTILPYDANKSGNHTVNVQITWTSTGSIFTQRGVVLDTVLTSAE